MEEPSERLAAVWVESEGGEEKILLTDISKSPLPTVYWDQPSRKRTHKNHSAFIMSTVQERKLSLMKSFQDGSGGKSNWQTFGSCKAPLSPAQCQKYRSNCQTHPMFVWQWAYCQWWYVKLENAAPKNGCPDGTGIMYQNVYRVIINGNCCLSCHEKGTRQNCAFTSVSCCNSVTPNTNPGKEQRSPMF